MEIFHVAKQSRIKETTSKQAPLQNVDVSPMINLYPLNVSLYYPGDDRLSFFVQLQLYGTLLASEPRLAGGRVLPSISF